MDRVEELSQRKQEILKEIADLPPMRKGSISEQFLESERKDGSKRKRGPYWLWSYKEKKKTVSRRLRSAEQRKRYGEQIEAFRRFKDLTAELAQVSQELADCIATDSDAEKKTSRL